MLSSIVKTQLSEVGAPLVEAAVVTLSNSAELQLSPAWEEDAFTMHRAAICFSAPAVGGLGVLLSAPRGDQLFRAEGQQIYQTGVFEINHASELATLTKRFGFHAEDVRSISYTKDQRRIKSFSVHFNEALLESKFRKYIHAFTRILEREALAPAGTAFDLSQASLSDGGVVQISVLPKAGLSKLVFSGGQNATGEDFVLLPRPANLTKIIFGRADPQSRRYQVGAKDLTAAQKIGSLFEVEIKSEKGFSFEGEVLHIALPLNDVLQILAKSNVINRDVAVEFEQELASADGIRLPQRMSTSLSRLSQVVAPAP